ncbi:MAG: NFACT family protein, partial [Eubacterium sp.]
SPILAREICFRAGVPDTASFSDLSTKQIKFLWQSFSDIRGEIQTGPLPTLYTFHRDILDFSTVNLHHLVDTDEAHYPKVSAMLEDFYYLKDKKIRFTARSANLKHQLGTLYKKSAKKLQNLRQDMQRSHSDEKSKLFGDLVTANIYQIERGMKSITVPDYNDPEMGEVTIPLKVNETPSQNAQRFYKKYNKAKRAQIQLADQIAITEEQTYYLDSLLNALEQCTELAELDEIRHEFDQSEFAKKNPNQKKAAKRPEASKPMHYLSSEGFHIYVGKNNYQNDYISTRLGVDEDCWLHVKDIPGSHVLVVADGRFITEATLLEAGMLAAWYSKARNSENVPVDYLEFKFLKKPNKSKPGMVIFTDQNTMYVTPKREAILSLTIID